MLNRDKSVSNDEGFQTREREFDPWLDHSLFILINKSLLQEDLYPFPTTLQQTTF